MEGRGYDEGALKVNGFNKGEIYDRKKQSVLELLGKFEKFCAAHNSDLLGAWGDYDLKMLLAAYAYYSREWKLPGKYINLKSISKSLLGQKKSGLSNTAVKLGMPPEPHPHIGINGARLAVENTSVLLFRKHYYKEYEKYGVPKFEVRRFALPIVDVAKFRQSNNNAIGKDSS
jgi:inhibitor of KinA sporulation pathway (predicted exonuclease)